MYRIFFNKRCLAVCSPKHKALTEPDAVLYSPDIHPKLEDLPRYFEDTPQLEKLYISTEDKAQTIARLTTNLTPITAGGGIVRNQKGEYLIIFHHGVWDFPKGMQEDGEDVSQTAIREVREECGVQDLQLCEHLCDTFHTYHRDGLFYLKTTSWFHMNYLGNGSDTHPQSEEDIERAIWALESQLPTYFSDTYPSIQFLYKLVTGQ